MPVRMGGCSAGDLGTTIYDSVDVPHGPGDRGPVAGRLGTAVLAFGVGCYNPTPATGIPCGPGEACPNGQTCDVTGLCVADGTGTDAPRLPVDSAGSDAAAAIDAPVDASVRVAPQLRAVSAVDGLTTTTTIMSPPGTIAGDLLLAHVADDGPLSASEVPTPAGWVRVIDRAAVQDRFVGLVFYRFAAASSESFTFTFPNDANSIHLMGFVGVDPSNPIAASDAAALPDTSQPTAPSITAPALAMLVTLYSLDLSTDTFLPIAGMTELYDELNGGLQVSGSIAAIPTAGPTGARVATRSGTNIGPTINFAIALAAR